MTFKRWYSLLFLLIVATAGGVFRMKYAVIDLENNLKNINKQIVFFQNSNHLLEAEWSVLNNPKRLERLANHHLKLRPTKGYQIIVWQQLPLPSQVSGTGPEINEDLKKMTLASVEGKNKITEGNNKTPLKNHTVEGLALVETRPEANQSSLPKAHGKKDPKNLSHATTATKAKKPLKLEHVIHALIDRAMQTGG